MTYTIRVSLAAFAAVTMMGLSGCTSRYMGPDARHEGLEHYNGEWVCESIRVVPQQVGSGPGEGVPVFVFSGVSRDIDLAAIDEVLTKARTHAERFSLEIGKSIFRVFGGTPGPDFTLPMDGSRGRVSDQDERVVLGVRLVWDGRAPVVERSFREDSQILDRYEVTSEGILVITRTVRLAGVVAKNPAQVVYRRDGQPSSSVSSENLFGRSGGAPREAWIPCEPDEAQVSHREPSGRAPLSRVDQ